MATNEELAIAYKVVKEISGDPAIGVIKELLDSLATQKEAKDSTPSDKEVRVLESKETR